MTTPFDTTNNGLNLTSNGVQQRQVNDNYVGVKDDMQGETVIKDCFIVAAKGVGTFKRSDYSRFDEGGLLFDLLLPRGITFNFFGTKVGGIKNVRCRNTWEDVSCSVGCVESDFIGSEYTVDLYLTGMNYQQVVKNSYCLVRNRTKISNKSTGISSQRETLYPVVPHMGCLTGFYEDVDVCTTKLKELHYIDMNREGLS